MCLRIGLPTSPTDGGPRGSHLAAARHSTAPRQEGSELSHCARCNAALFYTATTMNCRGAALMKLEHEKLRALASWYREIAERAGNPFIWEARLRTAEDLDAEADRIEERLH